MVIPTARVALLQHALDTYGSETEKTFATWRCFADADLEWRPHARSMTVREVLRHQLLSERRFFAEFLGLTEPTAAETLPAGETIDAFAQRLRQLAEPRLPQLAAADEAWWREPRKFFEVERERIWIFWRRVLHSAHHRTQLTGYLRQFDRPVPSTYGPTADVTWSGASPTLAV